MLIFENLIRNEYFPAELPPCFHSEDIANNYSFVSGKVNSTNHKKSSIPLTYSGYKSENSRRKFAIPNPYHYFKAVKVITDNSNEIMNIFNKSTISLSCPINKNPKMDEAYSRRSKSILNTKIEVEKLYQNNLYCIKLDINNFFDSIYTHTIPWAIHGKSLAKRDHSDSLFGNLLDKCIRNLNYEQTNGLLVGNAVSRIISEILLCTIDEKIQSNYPDISCKRFVDDYFIYLQDSTRIKNIISFIRTELSKFELYLNENKHDIIESPFIYGKPWVEEIRQFLHLDTDTFMDKLIITYNKYKDISILRYGLKVINLYGLSKRNWPQMQSKMLNLWTRFPSLSDIFVPIFYRYKNLINKNYLKAVLYNIITSSISLLHHQETIWALWCIKVFDIKVSNKIIKKVFDSNNTLAIIILLDVLHHGTYNMGSNELSSLIKKLREQIELYDIDENNQRNNLMWSSMWLLAYEADLNHWLDISDSPFSFARNNPFYTELIGKNIRFYNKNYQYTDDAVPYRKKNYVSDEKFIKEINELKKAISNIVKEMKNTKLKSVKLEILEKIDEVVSYDY